MGIEKFFNILKSNKDLNKNINIKNSNNFDFVYIDFNSIIHTSIEMAETKLNYIQYELISKKYNNDFILSDNSLDINLSNLDLNLSNLNHTTILKEKIFENLNFIFDECDKTIIKRLYISYDGIPTMSKIAEQRRRKYSKYIFDEIKAKIYKKYESTIDPIRKEYESKKINITLTTELNDYLNSEKFIDDIKKLINEKLEIIVSDKSKIGEGEKKIFEHITSNYKNGSYLIVSPDSDVIVLSLLHQNLMKILNIEADFLIIKLSNEKEYYSINNLRTNIIEYTKQKIDVLKIEERDFFPNYTHIVNDIIFLLQFLGNDFLPRLKGFSNKNNLQIIIELYLRQICRTKNRFKYLIFNENNVFKLNYDNLNSIFYKLYQNEDKMLYETFINYNYKNHNYLSSIFDLNKESPFLYDKLLSYINGYNKIISTIIKNKSSKSNNINGKYIYDNVIEKYKDKDIFIKEFLLIESDVNYPPTDLITNKTDNDLILDTINLIDKIISTILSNKIYKGKLKFIKYSTSVNDQYHLNQITSKLEHPKMILTEYDKNFYKFDKKLDEYYLMFNSDNDLNLGYIDVYSKNNFYKLSINNNLDEQKKTYYLEKVKNNNESKIKSICNSYLLGLFWNFDFYFNKNNHDMNSKYISTWFYDQDITPFISDLYEFFKNINYKNSMGNQMFYIISNTSSPYFIMKDKFINDYEHYLYITPNERINKKIINKYETILENKKIFPEIRKITEDILDGNILSHIDSYNSLYINKSRILGLNNFSYKDIEKLFLEVRIKE